ncbi:hypothetical protein NWUPM3A1_124 [Escherichia phage vB_EcoM_3A1_SA_NWU]|uniref:Uncharacterized protein n=4 Tax=Phapecoctavirus TaxID=2733124 RepID=A0A499PRV9_9CAUD|nr:hypothetical protein [Escherichia coli]YP_009786591.1 hypothetical protein HOR21_gp129 [Escherichia phage ESCO13]YP_009984918.1 hypothetical protein JR319_gp264 [Escherichia phage vB_EcoM-Ro121c4YLVW]YP_009985868.1 hypothetical protein JR323_gp263 [Escherichia phage nepoznato]AXA27942.1 hypothetical protein vBEcoMRo121lw_00127 [Escherichia phage vB_EcoM-Ro121lw]UPW38821.1 hypothetical protein ESCO37_00129 [Escherichia phage vB_EcoM_ESCO37]WIL78184.1 hypothetical protein NWUPM3A1_124 [Esche
MRFTRQEVVVLDEAMTMIVFYYEDIFCAAYHLNDIQIEWQQIAFLLDKSTHLDGFEYLEWDGAKEVKIVGLNHDQIVDMQCKLCHYQFSNKVKLERQLEVVKDDSTN